MYYTYEVKMLDVEVIELFNTRLYALYESEGPVQAPRTPSVNGVEAVEAWR